MSDWSSFEKEKAYTDRWRHFLNEQVGEGEDNSQQLLQRAANFLDKNKIKIASLPPDSIISNIDLPTGIVYETPENVIKILKEKISEIKDSITQETGGYLGLFTFLIKNFNNEQVQQMLALLMDASSLINEGLFDTIAGQFMQGFNKAAGQKSIVKKFKNLTNRELIFRRFTATLGAHYLKILVEREAARQQKQDNKYKIKQPRDTSLSVISSEIDKAINSIFNEPGREDFKNDVRKFVRTPVLRALKKDLQQAGFNVINERRQVIKLDSTMSVLAGLSSTLTRAGLDSNTILKVRNSVKQAIMTFLRKNKIKSDSLTSRQFKSNSPKDQVRREGRGLLNALLESSNIKDYISVLLNFLGWAKDKGYSIEENDYALIQTLSRQITRLRDPKIKLDKNVVKSVISVIKKLSIANIYKQKIIEKLVEIDKDSRN